MLPVLAATAEGRSPVPTQALKLLGGSVALSKGNRSPSDLKISASQRTGDVLTPGFPKVRGVWYFSLMITIANLAAIGGFVVYPAT